jgi:histidinol-phosphatase (PHP family)
MYDSHIHSYNSDGSQTMDEVCRQALEKGLTGLMFTDHAHLQYFEEYDTLKNIKAAIEEVHSVQEAYAGQLDILCGVELGEQQIAPDKAELILSLTDFDGVLGSIHWVQGNKWGKQYARIIFDETITEAEIDEYLGQYYRDLYQLAQVGEFDILAHLTCPLRYINSRYARGIDAMLHKDEIAEILKVIIRRGIALEVNTPAVKKYNTIPEVPILEMYRDFGGKLLTLGSDSHRNNNVGANFPQAKQILRDLGFSEYHYYRDRQPVGVKI